MLLMKIIQYSWYENIRFFSSKFLVYYFPCTPKFEFNKFRWMGKTFQKASILIGKTEETPSVLEAVQFHGINFTKNDALVKEVADLYKSRTLHELVENSHIAARHLQVWFGYFVHFKFRRLVLWIAL